MFDFLKGGKATLAVTLDRANKIYTPGETIHAKVNVQGVKDLQIQSGKIALVAREEFEVVSEDSDDNSTTKSKENEQVKAWEQAFLGETTVKGGSNETYEFNIPIPSDAMPTLEGGKILNLSWAVKTTLDRKLAGDVEDKQDVYIVPLPITRSAPGNFGFSNEPADAEMTLKLSSKEFAVGETVSGELTIRAKKDFDVTEIRFELMYREAVPKDRGNEFKQEQKQKLAGGTKLTAGQELVYPFQLTIPGSAPLSARTRHGSIVWKARGVLSRRLRGDTFVEQELTVMK
jgi:sporulation-control protein spo0M